VTQDWSSWLDQLQTGVTVARAALADGRHDSVLVDGPPADLGPLPPALEARARELLHDNHVLTAELAAAFAASGRQLKLVAAMHQRSPEASSFFDSRG
jgi:hypothetical protein